MPKFLTILGMVISLIIFVVFVLDLALQIPFRRFSMFMDVAFVICAAILAYLSWSTFREQA